MRGNSEEMSNGVPKEWVAWYEASEALAASDDIVVHRTVTTIGFGDWEVPAVEIARPDGGKYPWAAVTASAETWQEEILPAMENDWGARLDAARSRHPVVDP